MFNDSGGAPDFCKFAEKWASGSERLAALVPICVLSGIGVTSPGWLMDVLRKCVKELGPDGPTHEERGEAFIKMVLTPKTILVWTAGISSVVGCNFQSFVINRSEDLCVRADTTAGIYARSFIEVAFREFVSPGTLNGGFEKNGMDEEDELEPMLLVDIAHAIHVLCHNETRATVWNCIFGICRFEWQSEFCRLLRWYYDLYGTSTPGDFAVAILTIVYAFIIHRASQDVPAGCKAEDSATIGIIEQRYSSFRDPKAEAPLLDYILYVESRIMNPVCSRDIVPVNYLEVFHVYHTHGIPGIPYPRPNPNGGIREFAVSNYQRNEIARDLSFTPVPPIRNYCGGFMVQPMNAQDPPDWIPLEQHVDRKTIDYRTTVFQVVPDNLLGFLKLYLRLRLVVDQELRARNIPITPPLFTQAEGAILVEQIGHPIGRRVRTKNPFSPEDPRRKLLFWCRTGFEQEPDRMPFCIVRDGDGLADFYFSPTSELAIENPSREEQKDAVSWGSSFY